MQYLVGVTYTQCALERLNTFVYVCVDFSHSSMQLFIDDGTTELRSFCLHILMYLLHLNELQSTFYPWMKGL